MAEATASTQWRYLQSQGSPQAVLGLSLVQGLPILFYFQFHICSRAKINWTVSGKKEIEKGRGWMGGVTVLLVKLKSSLISMETFTS